MYIKEIQIKILFVCLGNICRSPAAQGVMNHLLSTEYNFVFFININHIMNKRLNI